MIKRRYYGINREQRKSEQDDAVLSLIVLICNYNKYVLAMKYSRHETALSLILLVYA